MNAASGIYIGLLVVGIILLVCYHRTGRLLKCILFTAITGGGALGLVWLAGKLLNLQLAFTPLTLAISGVLGIPGVVSMLLLQLL